MRAPENINFCLFGDCAYLEGELCSREKCVFNPKMVKWWEWNIIRDSDVKSIPPSGKYKVKNLYVEPDTQKLTIEYDIGGE